MEQGEFRRVHFKRVGVLMTFPSRNWCKNRRAQTSKGEEEGHLQEEDPYEHGWMERRGDSVTSLRSAVNEARQFQGFLRHILPPAFSTQAPPLV